MFIGHFAVGLAGKRLAPQVSLGTWFLAVQFVDLLWPVFLLLGWEHVRIDPGNTVVTPLDFYDYPISHSLFMSVCWAALFAIVYGLFHKRNIRPAIWLGVGVLSHWVLDLVVHRPDLPLSPWAGTAYLGLGLWNSRLVTMFVEGGLFAGGALIYMKQTRAKDKIGRFGFFGLLIFLLLIWLGNLFGNPPPNAEAIAWVGNAQWLLVIWGYWIDKHRSSAQQHEVVIAN